MKEGRLSRSLVGLILIFGAGAGIAPVHGQDSEGQLTSADRVFGLAKLWSEVKYTFANFDLVPDLDWDKAFQEYLPKAAEPQDDAEYFRLLTRFVALLHDGHTGVSAPGYIQRMTDMPPVSTESIEGKVVIVALADGGELDQAGIRAGAELTKIDGRPVSEVLKEMYPFIAASTPQSRDAEAYGRILAGPKGSRVAVETRDLQGNSRTATLTRDSGTAEAVRFYAGPMQRPLVEMRRLPEGVAYFALNSFGLEQVVADFDKLFDGLAGLRGMIIDVRRNGGGNSGYGDAIIGRLTDKPLAGFTGQTRQRISGLGDLWLKSDGGTIQSRGGSPFLGSLVLLTSRHTASAAEDFVVVLHGNERAVVVGERTCGSTGQPASIALPGGASARICANKCFYPDGRAFVGVGVIPDVEAAFTQKDVAMGRDAVLERGLEVLRSKMGAVSGDGITFKTVSVALAEGDFYSRHGELPKAMDAYKEALELEPNSAMANLRLAGIYRRQNNKEQAARHYSAAGFLQDDVWMVIGPFENSGGVGFDTQYPPEREVDPAKEYPGKGGNVKWIKPEHKETDSFTNLARLLKPNVWAAGYAAVRLHSPTARDVQFRIGSDDEVKVWLNSDLVLSSNYARYAAIDQEVVHVKLRSGTNQILVKVCNHTGAWGFYMRVTDEEGRGYEDVHPAPW